MDKKYTSFNQYYYKIKIFTFTTIRTTQNFHNHSACLPNSVQSKFWPNYSPYPCFLMLHLWHQDTSRRVEPGAHQHSLPLPSSSGQGTEIEKKAPRST